MNRKKRGAALVTALLLMVLLVILGVARLFSAQQTYRLVTHQELNTEAYYLALSGIRYYHTQSRTFTIGVPHERAVPKDDRSHFFQVYVDDTNTIHSRGYIQNAMNQVIAQRTLIVPNGQSMSMYDEKL